MKNILITGASSGIGKQIAETLHAQGFRVAGTSRHPEQHQTAYPLLRLDVNADDEAKAAVDSFLHTFGQIDVLINNAGYGIAGPVEETDMEEVKAQFETNFYGVVRMTRLVLPHMRARQSGLILNISSLGGIIGLPFQAFYSATKFALEGYTEAFRIELRPWNVHVVNINPGDFATGFTASRQIIRGLTATYHKGFTAALDMYEKEERNGSDPKMIAALVSKLIVRQKQYRVRYLTGSVLQKAGVFMKKISGSRFFEYVMIKMYGQS